MSGNRNPRWNDQSLERGDWIARQFFSAADLQLSPEEYAARYAHLWGCFSLDQYNYEDSALGEWVRRLAEILSSEKEIERCRHRFLTSNELAQIRRDKTERF
jgi:hypothetical protein